MYVMHVQIRVVRYNIQFTTTYVATFRIIARQKSQLKHFDNAQLILATHGKGRQLLLALGLDPLCPLFDSVTNDRYRLPGV